MNLKELSFQGRQSIPFSIDGLADKKIIDTAVISSGTMTITSVSHGLIAGDLVGIEGIDFRHEATIVSKNLNQATLNTAIKNDLTTPYNSEVKLESNENYYNGEFELLGVSNRNQFTIKVDKDAPDTTGDTITLVEENLANINNTFTVASVINSDTITIDISFADTVNLSGGIMINLAKVNIVTDVDINRFLTGYTKQEISNYYLVIIAGDSIVSRNRDINVDFNNRIQSSDSIQIDTQDTFAIFAFVPTQQSAQASDAQDFCKDKLRKAIISAYQGFEPAQVLNSPYDHIYFNGDAIFDYNTSYYVHRYDFACTFKINRCDSFTPKSVAIKNITIDYLKDLDLKAQDKIKF
jgi:hypothetical protein